jgi:hypothetical protein
MKSTLALASMLALCLTGSAPAHAQKTAGGGVKTSGTYKPAPPRPVTNHGGQHQAPAGTQKKLNCRRKFCHWH